MNSIHLVSRRRLLFAGATIAVASAIPASITSAFAPSLNDVRNINTLENMIAAIEKMFDKVENYENQWDGDGFGIAPLKEEGAVTYYDYEGNWITYALGRNVPENETSDEHAKMEKRLIIVMYNSLRWQANKSRKRIIIWRERPYVDYDTNFDTKDRTQLVFARCAMG